MSINVNDVGKGISLILDLATVAARALEAQQKVAGVVANAQAQGRTELTPDEWKVLFEADDAARGRLAQLVGK